MKKFKDYIIEAEIKWIKEELVYENNGFGLINKFNKLYIINTSSNKWIDTVKNIDSGIIYVDKLVKKK